MDQMTESRIELYKQYREQLLKKNCIIIPFDGKKIVIDTQTPEFGILDYYPKANKVLVRKTNTWYMMGLKFIKENIIENETL